MPKRSNASDSQFKRDEIADDLYNRLGAQDARHRETVNKKFGSNDLLHRLSEQLDIQGHQTVLDVGCGSGQHLNYFSRHLSGSGHAIGLDFSLAAARNTQSLGLTCIVADGSKLPIENESIDSINCAYAIYYFSDLKQTIEEFFRVLKQCGKMVICGPASDTNRELYTFHKNVTGQSPSDADVMALGFVESKVKQAIQAHHCGSVKELTFENRVSFPDHDEFLNYWTSTSLVRRTVPDENLDGAIAAARESLSSLAEPLSITKKTSILVTSKIN